MVIFYIIDAINKAQHKISKINNVLVNFNPNPFAPTDDLEKKKKAQLPTALWFLTDVTQVALNSVLWGLLIYIW